jgi:hypothetical protein
MTLRNIKTVVFAISVAACAFFVLLWMRSYWAESVLEWNGGVRVVISSSAGQIRLSIPKITFAGVPLLRWHSGLIQPDGIRAWSFRWDRHSLFVVIPHSLPIVAFALLSLATFKNPATENLTWRFSLRSALIAVAIISAVLGLGVSLFG